MYKECKLFECHDGDDYNKPFFFGFLDFTKKSVKIDDKKKEEDVGEWSVRSFLYLFFFFYFKSKVR